MIIAGIGLGAGFSVFCLVVAAVLDGCVVLSTVVGFAVVCSRVVETAVATRSLCSVVIGTTFSVVAGDSVLEATPCIDPGQEFLLHSSTDTGFFIC